MKLPTFAELNEVGQGLWGANFAELSIEDKKLCVQIAQQGVLAGILDSVALYFGVSLAETISSLPFAKIVGAIEDIDASLGPIAEWFEKSRLYEP